MSTPKQTKHRSLLETAALVGVPDGPLRRTATLWRKNRGVFHYAPFARPDTDNRRASTRCGRLLVDMTPVELSIADDPRVCSSCQSDEAVIWGRKVVRYAAAVREWGVLNDLVEKAEKLQASGSMTVSTTGHLRNLCRQLVEPPRHSTAFPDTPGLDDPDLHGEVSGFILALAQRAELVLTAAYDDLGDETIERNFRHACVAVAQAELQERVLRSPHLCPGVNREWMGRMARNVAEAWSKLRSVGQPCDSEAVMACMRATSWTLRDLELHDFRLLPENSVFSGAEFATPQEWARAEFSAMVNHVVTTCVGLLEEIHAAAHAANHPVLLLVAPKGALPREGSEIVNAVPPVAVAPSGASAWRLPETLARFITATNKSGELYGTAADASDDVVEVALGLWENTPRSELNSWPVVWRTACAI